MLLRPPMEVDAIYDPIRVSQPLGLMYIASHVRRQLLSVSLLDCFMEGEKNKTLRHSATSYDEFRQEVMKDFNNLTPKQFVEKHDTFDKNGINRRHIVRIGLEDEEIFDRISSESPTHIGISMISTSSHNTVVNLATKIRKRFADIKIMVGGAHATHAYEQILNDAQGSINHCILGDGQKTTVELLRRTTPKSGIAYIDHGTIINLKERSRMDFADFGLIENDFLHRNHLPIPATHTYDTQDRPYFDFMFSRGCEKSCEFCVAGTKNYGFIKSSMETIDTQLSNLVQHGYKEIVIQDDDLLRDKEHFKTILKLLKKHNLYWQDNGGVAIEDINEDIVQAILENNMCRALYIPINPRSRKVTRASKLLTITKNEGKPHLLKKLRKSGIYIYTSCIFGNGHQSSDDIDHEIESYKSLLNEGVVDQVLTFAVSHLPGTDNYRHFSNLIVDQNDWQGYSIFVPHANTYHMNVRQVQEAVVKANQEFNKLQNTAKPWGSAFPKFK